MGRYFNARHRSSKSVAARKRLTTAPLKSVQRLNYRPGNAAVAQRLRYLRWPSGNELCSSGAQLCLSVVKALVNVARAVIFRLHNACNILCSTNLSRRKKRPQTLPECYQRCYSADQRWLSGLERWWTFLNAPRTLQQRKLGGTRALVLLKIRLLTFWMTHTY